MSHQVEVEEAATSTAAAPAQYTSVQEATVPLLSAVPASKRLSTVTTVSTLTFRWIG